MVNTQLKILRVFGPTGAEVSSVLRQIRDDGCPGLRLLERDGEFAICVQDFGGNNVKFTVAGDVLTVTEVS